MIRMITTEGHIRRDVHVEKAGGGARRTAYGNIARKLPTPKGPKEPRRVSSHSLGERA